MPRKIIKDRVIVDDTFTLVSHADELPADGDLLIDLSLWPQVKERLAEHKGQIGLKVQGDTEPDEVASVLDAVDMVAIEFPVFRDGRGYSLGRLLRERYHFAGELRATGDVLRDQIFYLSRCGFNSFVVREDRCIEEALTGLSDFSVTYQADVHEKRPIYHRRTH